MHELSIAMSIIQIAEDEAKAVNSKKIVSLNLHVGTMAGIEFFALDTALELAVKGTLLEKSKITVTKIQAIGKCTDCDNEFPINSVIDECPACNCLFINILSGKELKIKSIVVEE